MPMVSKSMYVIDHGIYPALYGHLQTRLTPKPKNVANIRQRLSASRASLSPSQFNEFKFNRRASREKRVMRTVVPVLSGNDDIPNEEDIILLTKLAPITNDNIPRPTPDHVDGARREGVYTW